MTILVLNAGSTSVKVALFDDDLTRFAHGAVSGLRESPMIAFSAQSDGQEQSSFLPPETTHLQALDALLERVWSRAEPLRAVAHRVVHGGSMFKAPVLVDAAALDRLRTLEPMAPLHQPFNLAGIERAAALFPDVPQVAAFDTAFHAEQPESARLYALPRRLTDAGIVRYGFHGLSYQHVADELAAAGESFGRVIAAHLGGGASLCAMRDGCSVASTMGFTALDGVPMGTRVGDLDPGAVLHLIRVMGMSPEEVERVLYKESGLLGLSGVSGDMRTLLDSADPQAAMAVEVFVYRIAREIGSLAMALGGLDTLVFTGGIGEHAAPVRAKIAGAAAWLGVEIDGAANASHAPVLDKGGRVRVRIVRADEERVLARAARSLLVR